jgi:hypothetical protein
MDQPLEQERILDITEFYTSFNPCFNGSTSGAKISLFWE